MMKVDKLQNNKVLEIGLMTNQSTENKSERLLRLQELMKEDEILKNVDLEEKYLNRYLCCEKDPKAAFERMKIFYDLLREHPDWFPIIAPLAKKSVIDQDVRMVIPASDKEGRPIYLAKLGNVDMNTMKMVDMIEVDDIWFEALLLSDPLAAEKGLCVVMDIYNYSWKMIKWITPENVKITVKKLQALPFKDYRFHIVNDSFAIRAAIKIAWPFLPDYIKKMIKFHFSDWDSFHQHIEKLVLPVEYGGKMQMNYPELYRQLYERNQEIFQSFKLYRSLKK